MKLEIKFKNGSKQLIEDVEEYTVIDDKNANILPPMEEETFEVDLSRIKKELFRIPRKDDKQEQIRQLILEALSEADSTAQKFTIYVPKRKEDGRCRVSWLASYAKKMGGRVATFYEWILVLAQRISNGESWETICNNYDTAPNYWMVWWGKNRYGEDIFFIVGGCKYGVASNYSDVPIYSSTTMFVEEIVPLVRLNY